MFYYRHGFTRVAMVVRFMNGPYARLLRAAVTSPLRLDSRAVTALEYGIMAAFFCLSLLGIFTRFGAALTAMFSGISTSI